MKRVLFIHRSVGQNLIDEGNLQAHVRERARTTGIIVNFTDINNNQDHKIPGGDTKPVDYLNFFDRTSLKQDLVIIKSCYPNNAIKTAQDLKTLQTTYISMTDAFLKHSTGKLLIMTTPPLRPIRTSSTQASRARELALWLTRHEFGARIQTFDFYNELADQNNTLKSTYRRIFPWDSHPNKKASLTISPKLAIKIIDLIK